ncbi:MAG: hypothetical protein ABJF23_04700 [Bryobacteraceae bacterium]
MLRQALAIIECEQRDSPCLSFDNRPADNGTILIIYEIFYADDFRDGHLALVRSRLRAHL